MVERIFRLQYKGGNAFKMIHPVKANSLIEAKGKFLKGTRFTFQDIIVHK